VVATTSSIGSALAVAAVLWTSAASGDIFAIHNPDGSISFTDAPVTAEYKVVIRESQPDPKPLQGWKAVAHREAVRKRLDPLLVKAMIYVESRENPNAISPKGAMGLMQLMPGTARALGVEDPFRPGDNIRGGVQYLADMVERFRGRLDLALAAYNAGPGAVEKYGGLPPYPETRDYVTRVMDAYRRLRVEGEGDESPNAMRID
jgi:soluble lytic murein transglycosylase-like protein